MDIIEILQNVKQDYQNNYGLKNCFKDVYNFHKSMADYECTPLHSLDCMAEKYNVKKLYVKDESMRFGLNAFKGLGVSYAVHKIMEEYQKEKCTFVSCTDGNHGKALAWIAWKSGQKAVIFMPKGSEERRVHAIRQYQAEVFVTDMNYDDTVRYAAKFAKEKGFFFVQDTALPGYEQVSENIMYGYSTMIRETLEQMNEKPTHIFLQAGVGSMAGGVVWYLYEKYGMDLPFIGIIESEAVPCIFQSAKENRLVSIGGEPHTIMAGLNCGEANYISFPLLKSLSDCFIQCKDEITLKGMYRAEKPIGADIYFSSGESGAVGLGLIEEVLQNPSKIWKEQLKLNQESVILLFSTEGRLS